MTPSPVGPPGRRPSIARDRVLWAAAVASVALASATVATRHLRLGGEPVSGVTPVLSGGSLRATTEAGSSVVVLAHLAPERRSRKGSLATRLRLGVSTDPFGVVHRAFEGAKPGPTLRVRAGDTLTVVLENRLGAEALSGPEAADRRNTLRRPNTTSLHVHGLHVSPYEDDVFTAVGPGETKTYSYALPSDHPAGTFWYHAHYDGSSGLQTAGGMLGALIVDDDDECCRDHHHHHGSHEKKHHGSHKKKKTQHHQPALREDVVLTLEQTNLVAGKGRNYAYASVASRSRLPVVRGQPPVDLPAAVNDVNDTVGPAIAPLIQSLQNEALLNASFFTVNGLLNPILDQVLIREDEEGDFVRWRLINAATNDFVALNLEGGPCDAWVLARDGISLGQPRRVFTSSSDVLVVAPGSRADVAVYCDADAVLVSDGTDAALKAFVGEDTDVYSGPLFSIRVLLDQGKQKKRLGRRESSNKAPPPPLRAPSERIHASLLDLTPDRLGTFEWFQGGSSVKDGASYVDYGVNHHPYGTAPPIRLDLGKVHEWVVQAAGAGDPASSSSGHPFHMHTNHFQVAAVSHGAGLDYDVGDWRDTVTVPIRGNVTIRFRPLDYTGPSLAHCHIFTHLDTGMAAQLLILPPEEEAAFSNQHALP